MINRPNEYGTKTLQFAEQYNNGPIVIAPQQFEPQQVESREGYPVVEIFGPTVQGEGIDVGKPCYFLRLGYCDFRCAWCDSMHAVDPKQVKENATWMPAEHIVHELKRLDGYHRNLVISGGNPALWDLLPLIKALRNDTSRIWNIAVETQGSVWRDWLGKVDLLTVSPKGPKSKMHGKTTELFGPFMDKAYEALDASQIVVKIVVFDEADLTWAYGMCHTYGLDKVWLSCGTRSDDTMTTLMMRYRWLVNAALDAFGDGLVTASILPQMHVLLWGHAKGV